MKIVAFVLNLPWTTLGLLTALLSIPVRITLHVHPLAIIFTVKSFWWYQWLNGKKHVRAICNGHVIQLSPAVLVNDIDHELIHVEQYEREPFIHPFLYAWQSFNYGYRHNKYEHEAYTRSSNTYTGAQRIKVDL